MGSQTSACHSNIIKGRIILITCKRTIGGKLKYSMILLNRGSLNKLTRASTSKLVQLSNKLTIFELAPPQLKRHKRQKEDPSMYTKKLCIDYGPKT